jgi:ferric-dicitrate binding protein FerR (iron transport regulator)
METYFGGIYPENVRKKFAEWLMDEQNREEKDEILSEMWDRPDMEAGRSTEKSFRELQLRIFAPANRLASPVRTLLKVAAVLLLPLLSATVTYLYLERDTVPAGDVKLVECIVPNGEMRSILLPDSSEVKLNAGSMLVYPEHFGRTRTVYLNGEAYFSVARSEKQPFVINTTDMEVEVLGTVFNVSSYTDDDNSSVTLESGKVNVRLKNAADRDLLLAPSERVTFNRKSGLVEIQTVRVDAVTAWTGGSLAIQGMSIDEIAKTIRRRYGMEVYLNSHSYGDEQITMKLDREQDINGFMDVLKYLIPGLRYKIERDKLYIY